MYKYKVLTSMTAQSCENKFNELARDGWRLVRTQLNAVGSMIAVFERKIKESLR